ncbi:MAG: hypothetical protein ACHQC8_00610 [Solirubrobacterales bacterium]
MITNTCFTGGSFAELPEGEPADPPAPPLELGEEVLLEAGAGFAGTAGEALVGDDVGSDVEAGGSPEAADEELSALGGGVELEPTAGACGRINFTGRRTDAASVSSAREPAAPPTITPNPRNISTSSVETRGDGSVNPDPRGARASVAAGAIWSARSGARTRRRSATRLGLRDPIRAPHPRQ